MTEDQKNQYRHFISTTLVDAMHCFERGAMHKDQLLALVDHFDKDCVDDQQHAFFEAYRELIDKVEDFLS